MTKVILSSILALSLGQAAAETVKYDTLACTIVAATHLAATFDKNISKKQTDLALKVGAEGCYQIKKGTQIRVVQSLDSISMIQVQGNEYPLLLLNSAFTAGRSM